MTEGSPYINSLFNIKRTDEQAEETWSERQHEENRLLASLKETPNNLTLLYGPRGSGKSDLVNHVQQFVKYLHSVS